MADPQMPKSPDPAPSILGERQATVAERQAGRGRATPPPRPVTTRGFVAPVGGVVEGRAYFFDGHLAIADATVDAGAQFHALTGTVEYAKIHEEEWVAGDSIYWYSLGACLTNGTGVPVLPGTLRAEPPPEALKVGVADKDAPRPSVTGFVRLDAIPNAP